MPKKPEGRAHSRSTARAVSRFMGRIWTAASRGATIHSWYRVFDYSGCKAVRMDHGRDNLDVLRAALSARKPLAKSRSEKRPLLNVETARNSLSQWLAERS